MKRKDRRSYNEIPFLKKDLVEKYCSSRFNFETAENAISNAEENIEKSQKKLAEMDDVDDMIKEWFDAFVSINNYKIEIGMESKAYYMERMEKYGKLVISDYDEDLEKLYANYKININ